MSLAILVSSIIVYSNCANNFCSVFCGNQSCSTWTSNVCTTCFSTEYAKNATTNKCDLTTASGWVEVDKSPDAGGSIGMNYTTTTTCGSNPWRYRYYGQLTGTAKVSFTDATGPMVPHYQMRIICWVILIGSWNNNDQISVTLNGNETQSVLKTSSLVTEMICSTNPKKDDYVRFEKIFTHTTIAPYNITITTNNTSLKWGIK